MLASKGCFLCHRRHVRNQTGERLQRESTADGLHEGNGEPPDAEQWLVSGLLRTSRCVCQDGPGSDPDTDQLSASATAGQTPLSLLLLPASGVAEQQGRPHLRDPTGRWWHLCHTIGQTWSHGPAYLEGLETWSSWPPLPSSVSCDVVSTAMPRLCAGMSPQHLTPRCAVLITSRRGSFTRALGDPPPLPAYP